MQKSVRTLIKFYSKVLVVLYMNEPFLPTETTSDVMEPAFFNGSITASVKPVFQSASAHEESPNYSMPLFLAESKSSMEASLRSLGLYSNSSTQKKRTVEWHPCVRRKSQEMWNWSSTFQRTMGAPVWYYRTATLNQRSLTNTSSSLTQWDGM